MIKQSEDTKIISFDMDGVLADFGGNLIQKMANRPHLAHLITPDTFKTFTIWDLHKCFPEEYSDEIQSIIHAPGFYRDIPPIPGSLEIVERVLYSGYQTAICTKPTSKNPHCNTEKAAWVQEHLHPVVGVKGIADLIFTRNKKIYPFYTHIDDKEYYDEYLAGQVRWIPITFAQPWNVNDNNPLRMTHENYADIFARIGIFLKEPKRYWVS